MKFSFFITCLVFIVALLVSCLDEKTDEKHFDSDIRKIVSQQTIPDYWLDIECNQADEEILYFVHRSKA